MQKTTKTSTEGGKGSGKVTKKPHIPEWCCLQLSTLFLARGQSMRKLGTVLVLKTELPQVKLLKIFLRGKSVHQDLALCLNCFGLYRPLISGAL